MILDTIIKPKKFFDTENKRDVAMYSHFLRTGAWGKEGCPFTLEYPYLTVPDMIKDKLVHKFLKVKKYEGRH